MGLADGASPFALVDFGHGYDFAAHGHPTLASTGFGLDYAIGRSFLANFTGAVALNDAGQTQSGDWTFNANLRIAY